MLGNTFAAKQNSKPPNKEVPPKVGFMYTIFQSNCLTLCYLSVN
jgi:hypothetical protein